VRIPFKLTYFAVCLASTPIISYLFITSHLTMCTPFHLQKRKKKKKCTHPFTFYIWSETLW